MNGVPSSLERLKPHAQTRPPLRTARLCEAPDPKAVTLVRAMTGAGAVCEIVVPSPSWQLRFKPQLQSVPSFFSATEKFVPALIATIPARPGTCTGVATFAPDA